MAVSAVGNNPYLIVCALVLITIFLTEVMSNANPEKANRYTHLRWAKVFTDHANRLLTEVLECIGLKQEGITLYNIFFGQGCDPDIKRERLMERWVT